MTRLPDHRPQSPTINCELSDRVDGDERFEDDPDFDFYERNDEHADDDDEKDCDDIGT